MKVILKEDVLKLGSLGDEVDVKGGYARNYLIPQGKALPVNRANIKQINHQRSLLAQKRADAIDASKLMAQKLEEADLTFTMKSGESGKLFGSVTQKHIFDELAENGVELDRKKLHISSPIKTLGNHLVPIKLHSEVTANLRIKVVSETIESDGENPDEEATNSASTDETTEQTEQKEVTEETQETEDQ
jgi:large subunit ribosomal protein L9